MLLGLLGTGLLVGASGMVIALRLQSKHITEQPPIFEAPSQQVLFAALALLTVAIPAYAAARIDTAPIHNPGLVLAASLPFSPAFIYVILLGAAEQQQTCAV